MSAGDRTEDASVMVDHLVKDYRTGLGIKRVRAVNDVSFRVERGEIFGFVGPNGAGKTTTLRCLMGLVHPTRGACDLLGQRVPSRSARARVGFLPEAPYFHEYLTARELLDFAGRLFGMDKKARARRGAELLERVGLRDATDRAVRKFSKGMLQRVGLAQALINDPELVILDEPMSGLDPLGRKDVRDLILEQRDRGRTVLFSTHILSDVETVCDRVAIISGGRLHGVGAVDELIDPAVRGAEVVLVPKDAGVRELCPAGATVRDVGKELWVELTPDQDLEAFLARASGSAKIVSVKLVRESLEDVYVRFAREGARATVDANAGAVPAPPEISQT